MENIISLLTPKKMTFYINEKATLRQAIEKFEAHKFSVVPIIDEEGKYIDTLSEGDILRVIKNQENFNVRIAENVLVKDIEHYRPYQSIKIEASIREAFTLSLEQNFIPVTDDNDIFIGIIKRKDIIKCLSENYLVHLEKQ